MNDILTVQGRRVPFLRGQVPVGDLELDVYNPRIQYLVGQKGGNASESELENMIWENNAVKALANSIFQNGGVYEPILVQKQGKKYKVREGNCRTVASRKLLQQHSNDPRFATIPAMIFDMALTEEDLAVLLADMHVASKIKWDAYEQAKHVSDLFNVYGKTYEWLSDHLRLSKSKIVELLHAYNATTEYLKVNPNPDNVRKFSFFFELMRKKDLRNRFNTDLQFKQRFYGWLNTNKIPMAIQVRDLPAVLADPLAAKELDQKGMADAQRVLMQQDPSLESDLFHSVKLATVRLKAAPVSDIQDLKGGNTQKLIMLRELHRSIEDLATLAGVNL